MGVARASLDVRLLAAVQEGILRAVVNSHSRTREISGNEALKQKLNKSVSFNHYSSECTLKDTSTAKNGDLSSSHPK